MKILHLIYDHVNNPWVGGGGAVRAYEICKRLSASGHEVTVVSGRFPGARDYQEQGLCYEFVGSEKKYVLSTFSYAFEAARFVKNHGAEFDVIVEDFAPWNPVFSSLMTKRPIILHINHREGLNILKRWLILGLPFFFVERFYPKLFGNVTALSEETRKKIGIPDAVLVPAGINSSLLDDNAPDTVEDGAGIYILYLGRLHIKNKGLDTLLQSMRGFDLKLILVGRGKDEQRLKEMAGKLRLKNLEFSGFISENEKIKKLEGARILVLPSRFEGWGIVVIEAAACGKPVIVSDIPELRYAVDAGFGISFKTGDAKDLSQKINFLLGNDSIRNEMGMKGKEYAKNNTWDKIAEDYERFLLQVVKK